MAEYSLEASSYRAQNLVSGPTIPQRRLEMRFKLRQVIRRYTYIYV